MSIFSKKNEYRLMEYRLIRLSAVKVRYALQYRISKCSILEKIFTSNHRWHYYEVYSAPTDSTQSPTVNGFYFREVYNNLDYAKSVLEKMKSEYQIVKYFNEKFIEPQKLKEDKAWEDYFNHIENISNNYPYIIK